MGVIMCVRCGTGAIAWCASPDRHGGDEAEPAQPAGTEKPESMSRAEIAAEIDIFLRQHGYSAPSDAFRAFLRATRNQLLRY